jgi:site-specific DNA-methyltransferase (adenine-specific)
VTAKINPAIAKLAVPVERLKEDPANARKHSDRNIAAIMASLEEFGQQKPIVALKTGTVIAGNGTLQAALNLGWDKLAVAYFDSKGLAKAKAYAIADNRTGELATWDLDILSESLKDLRIEIPDFDFSTIGFNEAQILKIIGRDEDLLEDLVPTPKKTNIKVGEIYSLGDHRLMCGDSTDSGQVYGSLRPGKWKWPYPGKVGSIGPTKEAVGF